MAWGGAGRRGKAEHGGRSPEQDAGFGVKQEGVGWDQIQVYFFSRKMAVWLTLCLYFG